MVSFLLGVLGFCWVASLALSLATIAAMPALFARSRTTGRLRVFENVARVDDRDDLDARPKIREPETVEGLVRMALRKHLDGERARRADAVIAPLAERWRYQMMRPDQW